MIKLGRAYVPCIHPGERDPTHQREGGNNVYQAHLHLHQEGDPDDHEGPIGRMKVSNTLKGAWHKLKNA